MIVRYRPDVAYEQTVEKYLALLAEHNIHVRTFVEVGARDCAETIAFANALPGAHVYTFECNPAALPLCAEAVEAHENVTLVPAAVADRDGTIDFYPYDENPGASSTLPFTEGSAHQTGEQVTVPATTLSRFMAEQRIVRVDAMWLDIQGGELAALRGLGPALRDVKAIHTEVELTEIYAGQPLFWNVWWFLRRHGFILRAFPWFGGEFADAVFVHRTAVKTGRLRARARELRLLKETLPALRNYLKTK